MDSEIVDVVTDWESQSFSGGIDGLRDLADEEFTGAVTEGTGWLFFLNGRVVGVFDGDLDRFEGASGTAHRAPDPSLPLLFTMLATGGETKAQYYTEDTSLSSADDTLSAGNFTGYVELSENVLSGDYYVVYYGGRKLPCAFLGQSRDIVTGEEAFDRAADEVGIYEVMDVDVEITELPEPDEPDSSEAGGTTEASGPRAGSGDAPVDTTGGASPTDTSGGETSSADASSGGAPPTDTASGGSPSADTAGGGSQPADTAGREAPPADAASAERESSARGSATTESSSDPHGGDDGTAVSEERASADTAGERRGAASGAAAGPAGSESQGAGGRETGSSASAPSRPTDGGAAAAQSGAGGEIEAGTEPPDPEIASEREWQETRTIPSLDPSESSTDGTPSESVDDGSASVAVGDGRSGQTDGRASGVDANRRTTSGGGQQTASGSGQRTTSSSDRRTASSDSRQSTAGGRAARSEGRRNGGEGGRAGGRDESSEKLATLRERVTEVETQRDEAQAELQETREQLEQREEELTDVRSEREELSERVEELEAERDELREQLAEFEAQQPDGDRELAPGPALSGTNLFVRYDSKSEPTLETAHAETATRAEVEENLRLETHTEFDQAAVVVEGETYEEFLSDTVEYNFVQWVVRELLYELQETGAEGKLRDLYDAIPKIDRAELHGVVELVGEDQKIEGERPFDVILRDRMGEPLVVANVADTREATAEPAVSELIGDAREVAESRDSLGCAAYVSASFFEPRALEAATEETGGGLLSRNKRASYVKLARKRGFHLGLVESRDEGFHFTVPEL